MRWLLLHTAPLSGAENMALDEALMERARTSGEAVFRVYTWAEPTLSFGRNQTARGVYRPDRASANGISVVRRLTGGRALLHHREITYSVTAPLANGGRLNGGQPHGGRPAGASLRESYARINRLLVGGLRRLGVAVDVAAPLDRALPPSAAPCFERPAAGELVIDGRKLVGSAQWRDEGALLQHGSILVDDDQSLVAAVADHDVPPPMPAATLRAALQRVPSASEVADALFEAVRAEECPGAATLTLDSTIEAVMQRARDRYLDDRWTWRR